MRGRLLARCTRQTQQNAQAGPHFRSPAAQAGRRRVKRGYVNIYPVILSGGSGSRLWPLSRAALPKQLLPLVSERTMLQETVLRVAGWKGVAAPLIVCGNDHRFLVAEQLRQIDITPTAILLEAQGRNTAPAVAAAANYLHALDPDAVMLVLPADHTIACLLYTSPSPRD